MSSKSKMKAIMLWFSVIISSELSLAQINAVIPQPVVCPQGISSQCVQQQTMCQQGISGQCIQQPTVCQHGISGHCIQQPTVCQHGISGHCIQQPTVCQHGISGHCIQQPICTSQSICTQPSCAIPCAPTTPQPRPHPQPRPQNNDTNDHTVIIIDKPTPETHGKLERLSDGETSVSLTLTNIVHTNNTIYAPVNITNHNVINTPVYISSSDNVEEGGSEDRSTESPPDPQPDRPRPNPGRRPHKCCSVISPRVCRRIVGDWSCSHKKYHRCGSFCVAPKIYLRTHEMQFRESRLYVPPLRTRPRYVQHGSLDCSGCMSGTSQHCSEGCYTQTHCTRRRGCQYQDQEQFCREFGGEGCTEEDGYVEGNVSNEEEEIDLNYTIN